MNFKNMSIKQKSGLIYDQLYIKHYKFKIVT